MVTANKVARNKEHGDGSGKELEKERERETVVGREGRPSLSRILAASSNSREKKPLESRGRVGLRKTRGG
jgi:hypothetical protein